MKRLYSFENWSIQEKRKSKPDFLDIDKDGDKKEPMKKAAKEAKGKKGKGSKGITGAQKKLPKALRDSIMKRMNESVALDYLNELYKKGAISTDVYHIVKEEDIDLLDGFDELGDNASIKTEVLNHLEDLGGISSDAYSMELDSI